MLGAFFGLLAMAANIYYYVLIVRILLSWFQVDWYDQPYRTLHEITEPYLGIFRRFIPPLGMFDVSSIVAIFALIFLQNFLASLAASL